MGTVKGRIIEDDKRAGAKAPALLVNLRGSWRLAGTSAAALVGLVVLVAANRVVALFTG